MNTKRKPSYLLASLSLAAITALSACGGRNNPPAPAPAPVPGPVPPVTQPLPGNGADWVAQNVVPYLQSQYGNIYIQPPAFGGAVSIAGITFPAGQSITWAQAYSLIAQISMRSPTCSSNIQGNQPYWAQVNYGCLWSMLNGNDMAVLQSTYVAFQNLAGNYNYSNQYQATLYTVIDLLIGSNYSYYSTNNTYAYGNNGMGYIWAPNGAYTTPYYNGAQIYGGVNSGYYGNPYSGNSGQFGLNFGSGAGGWGANFGGVFNWR